MTDAVMYAKYNQDSNRIIYDILSGMPSEEREKNRGSHFSLAGGLNHMAGSTVYFLEMFKPALAGNANALKAISALPALPMEEPRGDEQWKKFGEALCAIDAAYVGMAEALGDSDMKLPVKLDWYDGNPDSVPIYYLLAQVVVHNAHHRGQISQTLDELKIENNVYEMHFLPE